MMVQGKSMVGVIPGTDFEEKYGEYYKPLSNLENAFNTAGLNIQFDLCVTPYTDNTYVRILYPGGAVLGASITGDSAIQAVKDVAEAVHF